ncbi:MAG: acylneuraminate cytidylyltransferase [Chloroflexi bacterium]|nr:acylneuraminate cytidylyltransferase [Chloroflexota bacterium]
MDQPLRCVAIIQGRMSASRLPGKVLRPIAGKPMLERVVERTRRARLVDEVFVATTADASDDPVAEFCQGRGYACWRGSQFDVLDRYYQAARLARAEVIIRITADCPLIDPQLIDLTVSEFYQVKADFAANRLPPPWHRTYPIGLDVEVCAFTGLEQAWREADKPHQREHVMPFFYEGIPVEAAHTNRPVSLYTSPRGFRVLYLNHDPDLGAMRWTVDTPEDLDLLNCIYDRFNGRDDFSWQEILALFQREPQLAQVNAAVHHKAYNDLDQRARKP